MTAQKLLQSPPGNNRPAVAVDLEGTLTAGSAWRGMSEYLIAHGREKEAKRYFFRHIPEYFLRKWAGRGLREFKNRWILGFLQLFRGYSLAEFQEMTEWAVENELWPQRRQQVLDELEQHQQKGRRVMVVTGLFEPYVASVIERLPGVEAIGTPIIFEDGLVTGELATPFNVGPRKVEALQPFMQEGKIYAAYGDTGSDRYMLEVSHHPVAVHPDETLRNIALGAGWRVLEEA